jgi:hypothetical protein
MGTLLNKGVIKGVSRHWGLQTVDSRPHRGLGRTGLSDLPLVAETVGPPGVALVLADGVPGASLPWTRSRFR